MTTKSIINHKISPKISIVMPTYNRAKDFLKEALISIVKQTFTDFELYIVDNGNDQTEEIVASFKDNRFIYHRIIPNRGEYWSTNFGASQSKSPYFTWVHSDDVLPDDSLQRRFDAINSTDLDFVHGDIIKIDPDGNEIEKLLATDNTSREVYNKYVTQLQKGEMAYLIHHTTILMKREFFHKTGPFDTSLPFAGDIDWLVRALYHGKYKRIPAYLYYYRKHPGARTTLYLKNGVDKIAVRKLIGERYATIS